MAQHKHCYGTMFHDSLHFETNENMAGKVFSFEVENAGLTRSDRHVKASIPEWVECRSCEEFDHCYKLCVAKLMLETAIARR
ncbi:hypothetical protein [Cohaesibacter intestini]|uniref:hypothetical protein n=1 Tax=Cohaesibacter intestini TaxID=2211145 RepID=UPI0013005DA2|nr:hypothetical protein [Cohaesibacter intestini]